MTYRTIILTALFFCVPSGAHAAVLLSEIAWMGTDESADNEWIELYNFSNTPTDLTGWTISGSITVTLAGTLPPHGVGILERTDDSTLPDVTAFQIFTGALPNGGGTLTIKDASGAVSDTATWGAEGAGLGGSNTIPKKTAQRTMTGSWVTAAPTPGEQNAQVSDPVATTTAATPTVSSSKSSGGGGGGSAKRSSASAPKENIPPKLEIKIEGPKTAYVNQEVSFGALPSGVGPSIEKSLSFDWNFGDTYTDKGKEARHVFEYPGEYVVVLEGAFAKQYAMARQEVKVLPVSFTLSKNAKGDTEVKNSANYETDLGGFTLRGGAAPFTFPKHTFVKANGTLVVPAKRIGFAPSLSLHDTQGSMVFALGHDTRTSAVARVSEPETVTMLPSVDTPVVRAENTVIRIGEASEVPKPGVFRSFFARIARIFGS